MMKNVLTTRGFRCLFFAVCLMGLLGVQPLFADGSNKLPVEKKSDCQPAETRRVPVPAIYRDLEGVALMISSPNFTEKDPPYAAVLSKDKIREVFRESITKSVLPYIKPSGADCSIQPKIYDVEVSPPEKWEEHVKIIDNPNIVTINVKVRIQRVDNQEDRPVVLFIFAKHRPNFRGALAPMGVSVFDLSKAPEELSADIERFRDSKYFLTVN